MAHLKRYVLVFLFNTEKKNSYAKWIQGKNWHMTSAFGWTFGFISLHFLSDQFFSLTFEHFSLSASTHKKMVKLIESANAINHIFKTCNWNWKTKGRFWSVIKMLLWWILICNLSGKLSRLIWVSGKKATETTTATKRTEEKCWWI